MDESSKEQLEALWEAVQQRWQEREAHEAFLGACHEQGALGVAAAKYRSVIDGADDERKPEAQKRIFSVSALATQALASSREPPARGVPRWITVMAALMAAATFGWLAWVLMR